nr:hypothetical protein [Tanacetum cinerariifolium]
CDGKCFRAFHATVESAEAAAESKCISLGRKQEGEGFAICCLQTMSKVIPQEMLAKVVERDTEEITDKDHSNCQGSTAHIQPSVVPSLEELYEAEAPPTVLKPSLSSNGA